MGILATIVSILISLIIFTSDRKQRIVSPVKFFFLLWSLILFLSCFHLYGLTPPSDEAYLLIMAMVVSFAIGHYIAIGGLMKRGKSRKEKKRIIISVSTRMKVFYALFVVCIVLNIIDCLIVFSYAAKGTPMWQIRNWTLEPIGSSNPILDRRSFLEEIVRTMVAAPFWTIAQPASAYFFFNAKKRGTKYLPLVLCLICLITASIAGGGGRLGFIYFLGCYILAFIIRNRVKPLLANKRQKRLLKLAAIAGIITVVIITTIRSGSGTFLQQGYLYFALAPTLLSHWLPILAAQAPSYGFLTTFGVHSYIFRGMESLGFGEFVPALYGQAYQTVLNAEKFVDVGPRVLNAFVTPVYYFYADGGVWFVIFASAIFGFLISRFCMKIERDINPQTFVLYMLVMYGVFVSFIRVQTVIPGFVISFIMAYLIIPKEMEEKNE